MLMKKRMLVPSDNGVRYLMRDYKKSLYNKTTSCGICDFINECIDLKKMIIVKKDHKFWETCVKLSKSQHNGGAFRYYKEIINKL